MVEVEVDRLKVHMKGIHHKIDDRKVFSILCPFPYFLVHT